ncbi:hypothetical protein ACFYNL_15030 [Streptomyces sp. NPDC007808]|uniref:hypothetical protein n=1 Tax=Streptomyces sp. NPDC007808 TaxID=3364779 RepID=UPI00369BBDE9
MTAALVLVFAPNAQANWCSYIENWTTADESRRWLDGYYSEVNWTLCDSPDDKNASLRMWREWDYYPDDGFDTKTFSECFSRYDGDISSTGIWDLPHDTGSYYFKLGVVDDYHTDWPLDVHEVYVDTSKEDSHPGPRCP